MRCEECLPLVEEYVDGELDARALQHIGAHLSSCAACAEALTELRREQEIYAHYQRDVEVKPAHWNIVRARISQEQDSLNGRPRTGFREWLARLFGSGRRFRPALALALLLVFIGVTAAIIYSSRHLSNEVATQPRKPDTVRPQGATEENAMPGKVSDNNQAIAGVENEKHSQSQTTANNGPRNPREQRVTLAVNRAQPARQQIKEALPRNAPQFGEAITDKDMMTSARRSAPFLAGDFDFEISRHAEKAEMLLRSFRNVRTPAAHHALDVSYEKEESRKLLYQNIALRRDAEARGDQSAAALLSTLEPILLDIAHLPERTRARDVRPIEERMVKKEIVAALQVRTLVASN